MPAIAWTMTGWEAAHGAHTWAQTNAHAGVQAVSTRGRAGLQGAKFGGQRALGKGR